MNVNSLGFGLACPPGVAMIQCYGYWIYDTLMGRLLKLYNPNYSKKGSDFCALVSTTGFYFYFFN